MKHFPILQGRAYMVELPRGATNPEIHTRSLTFDTPMEVDEWGYDYQSVKLPEGTWQIVGSLSEVTEEVAAELVDSYSIPKLPDFMRYDNQKYTDSAIETLESAILAEGYYLDENPKRIKDHDSFYDGNGRLNDEELYMIECEAEAEAQSRVLCRERCLLLRRVDL